jgi:CRP-like cAMP-binding protein
VTDRMLVIPRKKQRMRSLTESMKTPYGLEVVENCLTHPLPKDRLFCNLPQAMQAELDAISSSATYRRGEILFAEGQAPRGVFVISKGRVKLSASSSDGKSLIIRMADPREVVGLPGTISGKHHEVTAEAFERVQASFIPRKPFRDFVQAHGEVGLRVAEILSDIYHATYSRGSLPWTFGVGGRKAGSLPVGSDCGSGSRSRPRGGDVCDDQLGTIHFHEALALELREQAGHGFAGGANHTSNFFVSEGQRRAADIIRRLSFVYRVLLFRSVFFQSAR